MDPQQLPLEPLIAPTPISWWPLAPIWWIALGLIILTLILLIIYRVTKKSKHNKPTPPAIAFNIRQQAALQELANLEKPYNIEAGPWLQEVNKLLKRLCNLSYPTDNPKVLMGQTWLDFLDNKCPEAHLKQYPMLIEGEYRHNYHLCNETIDALYASLEKWITYHV